MRWVVVFWMVGMTRSVPAPAVIEVRNRQVCERLCADLKETRRFDCLCFDRVSRN